ncbi:hypothetical protein XM38_041290 [Halomicronema hongdechloris C2206]|uniref:EcxA zinc-binding domain-containing protein n=1 Tax=Halomicronema hongdechloris C2206 TaxID=1641165 RepID=A0A1Z3HSR4_9CYAN|nr:hypothetical protein XM38_041290 [Halomicronema hongdechloris C2206]
MDTYVFDADAFQFSPELLNQLAPDRWSHWGSQLTVYPLDYPIYNQILFVQGLVLSDVFYADRLARLRDAELKAGGQEVLTLAELFETVQQSVWSEVLPDSPQPAAISSLRRGLQRHHLAILSNLVLRGYGGIEQAQSLMEFLAAAGTIGAPDDARVLARHQLRQLQAAVDSRLGQDSLELTTRAHLEDVRDRIAKVLDAPLQGY